VFADVIHDCNITATCKLFSVCHFLPDLEYRQQLLSSISRGVLEAPKLRKFVGGQGSAPDPAGGVYDAPQTP